MGGCGIECGWVEDQHLVEWDKRSGDMSAHRVSSHSYIFVLSYNPIQV